MGKETPKAEPLVTHEADDWSIDYDGPAVSTAWYLFGPKGAPHPCAAVLSVDKRVMGSGEAEMERWKALFTAAPVMLEALKGCLPERVNLTNQNVPDSTNVPLDISMGQLRAIANVIAQAEGRTP